MPLPRGRPKKVPLLSPSEAAKVVGCHPNSVRTWIRNNEIPYQRYPNNRIKIKSDDLKKFVKDKYGLEIK
jgi:excisionase family DNA binding protein